ncbi:PKD domain-containing protein [Deinococcus cellulosilyticus]|uniref:PKD domain-containing protein n=1 Tax=Deinococcus cellulosilyticus (strain DSM 18568 / NBRC 106333 / KACC 11606 / 5516J-15) TaxID=1223518 RepID=A0A511MV94_DEIC1|nr:PKD domain-containing protein [Deinococcus cellulosilyticus]GEM44499.1 hypothetical protein DC3_01340 [Deinococcus cellulosilyticus NBRC 106333 = KACC 11606]
MQKVPMKWKALFLPLVLGSLLVACGETSSVPAPVKPANPTRVTVQAKAGYVEISWENTASNILGFEIYRETLAKVGTNQVKPQALSLLTRVGKNACTNAEKTLCSYQDKTVQPGTSYRYAVAVRGAEANSDQVASGPVAAPVNSAPTSKGIQNLTAPRGSQNQTIDLKTIFSDQEDAATALRFAALSSRPDVASATLDGGVLTLKFLAAGEATVTVTATDTGGLMVSSTFTVTVNNNNTPPAAKPIPDVVIRKGSAPQILNLPEYFSDVQDSSLTYALVSNSAPAVVIPELKGSQLHLTFLGLGTAELVLRATDSEGLLVTAPLKVSVTDDGNQPPVLKPIPDVVGVEGASHQVIYLQEHFSDPEGGSTLYYNLLENSNPAVVKPTLNGSVLDLVFGETGTSTLKVRVTDVGGLYTDATIKVTVNEKPNTAPIALTFPTDTPTEGDPESTLRVSTYFQDREQGSATLTYSLLENSNPAALSASLTGDQLKLGYLKEGTATLKVRATDRGGLSTDNTFKFTVLHRNVPPVATTIADQTLTLGLNPFVQDLSKVFSDPEDGAAGLTYSVVADSVPGVVDVKFSGAQMTVMALKTGTTQLKVRATDQAGASAEVSFKVTVQVSTKPVAVLEASSLHTATQLGVVFDTTKSNDDSGIAAMFLDFGDGSPEISSSDPFSSVGKNYGKFGTYTAKLTIKSRDGEEATTTLPITVGSAPGQVLDYGFLDYSRSGASDLLLPMLGRDEAGNLHLAYEATACTTTCDMAVVNVSAVPSAEGMTFNWNQEEYIHTPTPQDLKRLQMAVDPQGNRHFVTESVVADANDQKTRGVLQVRADGTPGWRLTLPSSLPVAEFSTTTSSPLIPTHLAVSRDSVYLVGNTSASIDASTSVQLGFVQKIQNGTVSWTKFFGTPSKTCDTQNQLQFNAVTLDGNGSLLIAGASSQIQQTDCAPAGSTAHPVLLSLDGAGNLIWQQNLPLVRGGWSLNSEMHLLAHNNMLVLSTEASLNDKTQASVFLLNTAGGILSQDTLGTLEDVTHITGMAPSPDGQVFVLGYSSMALDAAPQGETDPFLRKYSLSGETMFTVQYSADTLPEVTRDLVTIGNHSYMILYIPTARGLLLNLQRIDNQGNQISN